MADPYQITSATRANRSKTKPVHCLLCQPHFYIKNPFFIFPLEQQLLARLVSQVSQAKGRQSLSLLAAETDGEQQQQGNTVFGVTTASSACKINEF